MAGVHNSYTVREDRLWMEGVWLEGFIGRIYKQTGGVQGWLEGWRRGGGGRVSRFESTREPILLVRHGYVKIGHGPRRNESILCTHFHYSSY